MCSGNAQVFLCAVYRTIDSLPLLLLLLLVELANGNAEVEVLVEVVVEVELEVIAAMEMLAAGYRLASSRVNTASRNSLGNCLWREATGAHCTGGSWIFVDCVDFADIAEGGNV